MGISAVVVTFNEELNLERCLQGLIFADELIVVDSFSTDKTVEIAHRFADKVVQRPFKGMSDQKNVAMEMTAHDWVIVLDADEVVSPELAAEMRKAVESDKYVAYNIPRLSYFLGKPIRHCGWYPDPVIKFMRKSKATHPDRIIHAGVKVNGSIGLLRNDLIHYSYNNMDDVFRKTFNFSSKTARQKFIEGRRFRLSDVVFRPGLTFLKKYVVQQGFRDGLRGFMISSLAQISVFLRYAALWEMSLHRDSDRD